MAKYDLHLKGYVGDYDFDADYVDYILDKFSDRNVTVCIDSTGGSLATGLSIAGAFRNHGDVSVHFVGLNASAATIAALGAKEVTIDSQAMYLIHKCSASVIECVSLNSDQLAAKIEELEKTKAALDKFDISAAQAYAARCKKDPKDLYDLMAVGGWLTAQEALEWGFVDKITDLEEDRAPVLDDITASVFTAKGIPIPEIAKMKGVGSQQDKTDSVIDRILNRIDRFFSPDKTSNNMDKTTDKGPAVDSAATREVTASSPASQKKEDEKGADKKQTVIAADGDTETVEDPRDAEIRDLKEKNRILEAKLAGKPADAHAHVVENSKQPNDTFFADLKSARDLFDSLP